MNQIINDYLDDIEYYWSDDDHDTDVEIIEISDETLQAIACLERNFSYQPNATVEEMYNLLYEKDFHVDTINEAIELFQEKKEF